LANLVNQIRFYILGWRGHANLYLGGRGWT